MSAQESGKTSHPLEWKWIVIGALVGVILLAFVLPVAGTFENSFVPILMGTVAFLLTGIIVGYRSPGVTIREAALAGLLTIIVADVMIFWVFDISLDIMEGVIFVVVGYLLSLVGGWIGEVMQGTKEPVGKVKGLQWPWILVGVAVGFILNYVAVFFLFIVFKFDVTGLLISFAFSFVIMGIIVGYKSPGVTIIEAALAGVGLIVLEYILVAAGLGGGRFTADYLMYGLIGGFILGLVGGWIGELMQEKEPVE